ncbi:MAG: 50S ribosomal protein L4 [Candidatus Diapherotrites archaeon]
MKAVVHSLDGKELKEISLPEAFEAEIDEALIKRAVLSIQSARVQRKGASHAAGRDYAIFFSALRSKPSMYRVINTEHARLPRLKNRRYPLSGRVAGVSHAVKGTRAHPLKPEKNPAEKINKKEKKKATASAIAATAKPELVKKRGHLFAKDTRLPLVVEDKFEELKKTREVVHALEKLNLFEDVEKVKKKKKKVRAGKGKKRGRKYKGGKSVLIVTGKNASVFNAARNLPGVEIVEARNLNAELLAPGAVPGRLTLWTESALKFLGK